jgi:hypothetical protein
MKLIMLPLLVSLAYLGIEHRGEIIDQYRAAYPVDPAKRAVLDHCAAAAPNFNRLDMDERQKCYESNLTPAPIGLAAMPSPYYELSPSHLPGDDVRRQEANSGFRTGELGGLISSAEAAPALREPSVPQRLPIAPAHAAAARTPATAAHHVPAHHAPLATAQTATWRSR